MRELKFIVVGLAQTQGSTRAFVPKSWVQRAAAAGTQARAVVTNDNPKTKGWRQTIATCAALELRRAEHAGRFFAGPVCLELVFYLPRPKTLLTKKFAGVDVPHTKKPDVSKLVRAAEDALTSVVWHDDSQVIDLIARKRYCAAGEYPRAVITVRETNPVRSLLEAS